MVHTLTKRIIKSIVVIIVGLTFGRKQIIKNFISNPILIKENSFSLYLGASQNNDKKKIPYYISKASIIFIQSDT